MTLDELKDYLRKSGIKHFNVVTNLVGPDNEWTEAEQEEDCCQLVPDHDPCVEVGKTEPWNGWTEEEKRELGWYPKPGQTTPEELLANAEQKYGKGNVHLKIRETGPRPCGEKITRWSGSLSCCTSPTELVKFSGATTAEPDDVKTYRVLVGTGEPPITWHTIGAGVTVAKTDATSARANFDDCFCKPVVIYAQDTCLSVAPWVVGRPDGSWASIDDESLSSPFGWYQDGTTGSFYITGFNDDNTRVSTQHYFGAEYVGTKEVVCGTTMPGINENPIVTPADGSQAFEKCENANIWVRLREGFSNVWEVRYAIDSQSTSEYTPGTCEDELLIDEDESLSVLADDSSGMLDWYGGVPPYSIVLGGVEIYLDADKTTTQVESYNDTAIRIYSADTCGALTATVTDSCGTSVRHHFKATSGQYEVVWSTGALYGYYEARLTDVTPTSPGTPVDDPINDDLPWYYGHYVMNRAYLSTGYHGGLAPETPIASVCSYYYLSCTDHSNDSLNDEYIGGFEWHPLPKSLLGTGPFCPDPADFYVWYLALPYAGASHGYQIYEWIC